MWGVGRRAAGRYVRGRATLAPTLGSGGAARLRKGGAHDGLAKAPRQPSLWPALATHPLRFWPWPVGGMPATHCSRCDHIQTRSLISAATMPATAAAGRMPSFSTSATISSTRPAPAPLQLRREASASVDTSKQAKTTKRKTGAPPPVLSITKEAARRVRELLSLQASAVGANDATGSSAPGAAACADAGPIGVRVGLRRRGCSGLSYRLEYVPSAASIDKLDCVVEAHGVTVVVDRAAVMFLVGTTMDFTTTALGCEFVFSNPNQETACGCGQSFNLRPAQMIPAEGNTP
eukprot:GHVT01039404.1.p1 GENE.GHVT01039404.1~~GHVT01039404.1.p1  ORF type:complete len:291 (+),score=58.84 GHVT01039404.1:687-1559(+)